MSRKEMLAAVKSRIEKIKEDIVWLESEGRVPAGACTWNDTLAEDTGLYIADETAIDWLSDDDLKRIIETYEI